METKTETKTETYTDAQATDEAVLLLVRKLRRLHASAYVDLMNRLPEGAKQALMFADHRADRLRNDGVTREYIDRFADLEEDEA